MPVSDTSLHMFVQERACAGGDNIKFLSGNWFLSPFIFWVASVAIHFEHLTIHQHAVDFRRAALFWCKCKSSI